MNTAETLNLLIELAPALAEMVEARKGEGEAKDEPPPLPEGCKELAGHPWLCVDKRGTMRTRECRRGNEWGPVLTVVGEKGDPISQLSHTTQAAVEAWRSENPVATAEVDRLKAQVADLKELLGWARHHLVTLLDSDALNRIASSIRDYEKAIEGRGLATPIVATLPLACRPCRPNTPEPAQACPPCPVCAAPGGRG